MALSTTPIASGPWTRSSILDYARAVAERIRGQPTRSTGAGSSHGKMDAVARVGTAQVGYQRLAHETRKGMVSGH